MSSAEELQRMAGELRGIDQETQAQPVEERQAEEPEQQTPEPQAEVPEQRDEADAQWVARLFGTKSCTPAAGRLHPQRRGRPVTIMRACVACGKPSPESHCPDHPPKPWATSKRKQRIRLSGSGEQARRKRILERDMRTCHVCDEPGADQVDHVIPLSQGGADEDWNLASIHAQPCHRDKTAAEARRARE
jgi:5-methylcytosine-specific restriction enzyme A